ncbi:MAG TPA: flagellar protein FlaG [Candidatus Ozemobacteraceae bacterium]|nr:flagellar protein FlaG [Candidatus Ozemobacteraceae bacterium]
MDINSVKPVSPQVPKPASTPSSGVESHGDTAHAPLPGQVNSEVAAQPQDIRERDLKDAVDKMSQTAQIFDRSLKFQIHEETNTMMVAVVDTNTNKVIREIPPKEILDMFARMQDYLGLIFDKKA